MRVLIITEMPNWGEPDAMFEMLGRIVAVVATRDEATDKLAELEDREPDLVFIAQEWEVRS